MSIPNQEMHRIVTTAIIFRPDGRMLITKRAPHKKVWPGLWTVPGGGLETDDYVHREPTHVGDTYQWYNPLRHSISREIFEETGLEINNPWLVCDLTFIRPDGVPVLVLSYAADLAQNKADPGVWHDVVTLDDDATAFAWVNLDEAREYSLIAGIYHELELAFAMWLIRVENERI